MSTTVDQIHRERSDSYCSVDENGGTRRRRHDCGAQGKLPPVSAATHNRPGPEGPLRTDGGGQRDGGDVSGLETPVVLLAGQLIRARMDEWLSGTQRYLVTRS